MNAPPRALDGASFILDAPKDIPSIWGDGRRVAWASGEGLLVVGPSGVGKTTLVQQLVLRRLGLRSPNLLELPVTPEPRRVLYIAADRPSQAQRSFARMCDEQDRATLRDRLSVWRGPLPFDLGTRPEALAEFAAEHGAGTVVIDSLKDVALDLVKDDVGARVNAAFQHALAAGLEVVAQHHQRKSAPGAPAPRQLADVYGSTWITAGAGSVLLLWGEPGDLVVELRHLKQPAEDVGPLTLLHDHDTGLPIVQRGVDLLAMLQRAPNGLTAQDAAKALLDVTKPNRNQVEKARRRLDGLVSDQLALKITGGAGEAVVYRSLVRQETLFEGSREGSRDANPRDPSRAGETPHDSALDGVTQGVTGVTPLGVTRPPSSIEGRA